MDTQWQAALAQEIIHAARVYHSDAQALEYLSGFAFSLARWLNDTSVVEWDNIHSVCEQRYVSLRSGSKTCFDENMLGRCEVYIAKRAKRVQRIICIAACAVILFGIFSVTDYVAIKHFNQVPRFRYETGWDSSNPDQLVYKTLFFTAVRKNPGTENEVVEILK